MDKFKIIINKAIDMFVNICVYGLLFLSFTTLFSGDRDTGIVYFLAFVILRTLILAEDIRDILKQQKYIIIDTDSEEEYDEETDEIE